MSRGSLGRQPAKPQKPHETLPACKTSGVVAAAKGPVSGLQKRRLVHLSLASLSRPQRFFWLKPSTLASSTPGGQKMHSGLSLLGGVGSPAERTLSHVRQWALLAGGGLVL